jgi:DNA-binding phage protein
MRFDTGRLIADLGGASAVARSLGLTRTSPYKWAERGGPSRAMMLRIKAAYPDINLGDYFVMEN